MASLAQGFHQGVGPADLVYLATNLPASLARLWAEGRGWLSLSLLPTLFSTPEHVALVHPHLLKRPLLKHWLYMDFGR